MKVLSKRILDLSVSLPVMILLLPAFAVIVAVIKLTNRGPAIFKQERAGKDGVPFMFYKFRTMKNDVDPFGPSPKSSDDLRLTRIKRLLLQHLLVVLPISIILKDTLGNEV